MECKTYELKVDKSHLMKDTLEGLRRLFLEAKWFYNNLIANGDFSYPAYKQTTVLVRTKDGKFEARELRYLSAQMRQEIVRTTKNSLKSLLRLRETGRKAGFLRFKSRITSIRLTQYLKTHRILSDKFKMQNFGQLLSLNGVNQIPQKCEFAQATIESRNGDFFVHLTTFNEPQYFEPGNAAIGIDIGIRHQLTLSNGVQVNTSLGRSHRVRRLQRELARRNKGGRNWLKTREKLGKELRHISNHRRDIRAKVVSKLTSNYREIAIQEENISGWQKLWGKGVTESAIGGIMSDLKAKSHTLTLVERFAPTTQLCSQCRSRNKTDLADIVYHCSNCNLVTDRDLNASINIWRAIPAERREFTPVDTLAAANLVDYFNSIPGVLASLVAEAGSQPSATKANGH